MMDSVEANGKTVEEAIELVLKQLDARREEVEIEVLSPGKAGLFGIGGNLQGCGVRRWRTMVDLSNLPRPLWTIF